MSPKAVKYYIDTSALIRIFRFYPKSLVIPIWEKLEEMFKSKQLISHRVVYDEITTSSKVQDILSEKITPLKSSFQTMKDSQLIIVADIVNKFPGLIDPNREKEQADPWLIAMAVEERSKNQEEMLYVVSEENETKKNRIPAVCKHYKLEHLNLERFFEMIGVDFNVSFK